MTIKLAVEPRAAHPHLHLRRRHLRRVALGDPAQHPRDACLCRRVPRRAPARAAGPGRPRDGHCDLRLGAGHADRHVLPCLVHADPRRAGAQVRCLRVLLARALRRDHLRHAHRRRPAQGLDRGHDRASSLRGDRAGGASTPTSASRSATAISPAASSSCPRLSAPSGFAELLVSIKDRQGTVSINPFDSVIPKLKDVTGYWKTIVRSGVHRHVHRHHPRRGRGRRRMVLVRGRQAREQGAGEVRQGLDRRPDGRGDRRQRLRSRCRDPGADARHPRLGARGRAARRDAHPRRAAGPDDHGRGAAVRLRRRGHDDVRHARHPVLRPHADAPPDQGAAGAQDDHRADHPRAVHDRLLRDLAAACSTST